MVHRDLKLENLLLAKPGDISCVKIADFGLAKQVRGMAALAAQLSAGSCWHGCYTAAAYLPKCGVV